MALLLQYVCRSGSLLSAVAHSIAIVSLTWNYGMCNADNWRAGASQPSRTSGSDFL